MSSPQSAPVARRLAMYPDTLTGPINFSKVARMWSAVISASNESIELIRSVAPLKYAYVQRFQVNEQRRNMSTAYCFQCTLRVLQFVFIILNKCSNVNIEWIYCM